MLQSAFASKVPQRCYESIITTIWKVRARGCSRSRSRSRLCCVVLTPLSYLIVPMVCNRHVHYSHSQSGL
jgi:hypothetical protein